MRLGPDGSHAHLVVMRSTGGSLSNCISVLGTAGGELGWPSLIISSYALRTKSKSIKAPGKAGDQIPCARATCSSLEPPATYLVLN